MIAHLRVPGNGAHDLAVDPAADVPHVFAHDADGHNDRDAGNGGTDALDIEIREPVLDNVALIALVGYLLFLGRLDAAQDDVLAAEVFDLFLGFVTGALADREHGNDGADAEHDAEHGQHRAQFVKPQALHPEANGASQAEQGRSADYADGRR